MTIFYTVPFRGKEKYQKEYDAILSLLERTGATVISPEKGNYLNSISPNEPVSKDTPKHIHYEAIKRGILAADAVVFEISHESFQIGHEMTLAIQAKKHVLCLSLFENFERKIYSKFFHGARYSLGTVEQEIERFLHICAQEKLPNRFNFFLSNSHLQFLEKQAELYDMSISEYIRQLIDKDKTS